MAFNRAKVMQVSLLQPEKGVQLPVAMTVDERTTLKHLEKI